MSHPTRACWFVFAAILANPVGAQEYPAKPIRIIITGGAGGSTDVVARIVGDKLTGVVGQPIVYDNRPGASGIIAAELTAKSAPEVPTMSEAGIGGYETENWYGLLMPVATPRAIVDLINARTSEVITRPDTRAALARVEVEAVGSSPQEFAKFISAEMAKFAALIKHAGIKAE